MPVRPLLDAREPARFGAKAATLAALAARHRVPDGFAVAADASEEDVRALVPAAYAALGPEATVAVRSSAIDEDSRDASFAGQHETILGVRGADAVVEAALAVRASATSERAAAYRREKGIDGVPRVAVLVQRMVDATASVIAFTADPVSGDDDLVVVNACRGLGDAMASGEVTPDMYQVRKSDLEVIFANAALVGAALTHAQVQQVARLALELEREAGYSVDIEAAFEHDTLHLLQSRPITAAGERDDDFPITWPEPGDEELTWQREDAHFGFVVLPLSADWVNEGPSTGIKMRLQAAGVPMKLRAAEFHGRIYMAQRIEAPPEQRPAVMREALVKRRELARPLATEWEQRHRPKVREHFEWMAALRPLEMTAPKAVEAWAELWRRHNHVWLIHMTVTGGAYAAMEELLAMYEELTGRPGYEAAALTQGLAHTLQQMQRDMYELGETVRRLPDVRAAIASGVIDPEVLRDLPGGDVFAGAFAAFLAKHGQAGQPNEDFVTPSWADDPSALVGEIRRALEAPAEHPDGRLAKTLAEAEATLERARAILRDRPEQLRRFDELVELARAVGPLTEEHNYWIDRFSQHHMRRSALAFGDRLVADGSIDLREDVFHLYMTEVAGALRDPRDLRALIAERERRHLRNMRRRAPKTLGAPAAEAAQLPAATRARLDLGYTAEQDDPSVVKGVAASAGLARGPARLVRDPSDLGRVRAGDVLVCRSSNVSYVPVYGKVAAVVTEVGGSLSHAAVVAREFGVPCVVGTSVALTTLRDGEMVEVDGSAGIVRHIAARVEVMR